MSEDRGKAIRFVKGKYVGYEGWIDASARPRKKRSPYVDVIIDMDGNELGFAIRSQKMDDWPIVTYTPDGGDFELYADFTDLMKDGLNY